MGLVEFHVLLCYFQASHLPMIRDLSNPLRIPIAVDWVTPQLISRGRGGIHDVPFGWCLDGTNGASWLFRRTLLPAVVDGRELGSADGWLGPCCQQGYLRNPVLMASVECSPNSMDSSDSESSDCGEISLPVEIPMGDVTEAAVCLGST